MLSAKSSSPAERHREAFTESLLSGKVSPRGKTPSVRVSSLSAKGPNPVVIRGLKPSEKGNCKASGM
jgi:hypothetical protein